MKKFFIFSLVLMLCLTTFVVPSFATEYPDFPRTYYKYAIDIVWTDKDNSGNDIVRLTSVGVDDETLLDDIIVTYSGLNNSQNKHEIKITREGYFTYKLFNYKLVGDSWSMLSNSVEAVSSFYMINSDDVVYSSVDILDTDGNLFFGVPPATLEAQIMAMVAETIPDLQTDLMTKITTIVPYGIGCLALLISLVLLVKVLRRYLPR